MAYYITGDCHGRFEKIIAFCQNYQTSKKDVMILLGDVGLNLWFNKKEQENKEKLSSLPLSFLCIHGNHEERPFLLPAYQEKQWKGGSVYYEEKYPDLLFAKDGEIYDFDGETAIALGGAYSVDKYFRLTANLPWFDSEQPTEEIKSYVEKQLKKTSKVDYVLSHTCPLMYEPTDLLIDFMEPERVDKSTEEWLNGISRKLTYKKWYFGHFHENREYLDAEMLFEGIKELGQKNFLQKTGRPQYRIGELVLFYFDNGKEETESYGKIAVVDAHGTVGQRKEVSYDIQGYDDILYKHITESNVFGMSES